MSPLSKLVNRFQGFTLAELLIALAILGVIAVFTIPKILVEQQHQKYNAIAKEAMASSYGVFSQAKLQGQISGSTRFSDITSYFNYVSLDTSTLIDDATTWTSAQCSTAQPCYRMHSGALLMAQCGFGGTSNNNALIFLIDPDGVYGNTTTGPSKSLQFSIQYNGRQSIRGLDLSVQTTSDCGFWGNGQPDTIPVWFSL